MITELTSEQFKTTMAGQMVDATDWAEPAVDVWPYVEHLVKSGLVSEYVFQNNLVELVYRNQNNTFDHVLLPNSDQDIYTVIVVDLIKKEIYGHFTLNLKKEYGLYEE